MKQKDWNGNSKSVYSTMATNSHSKNERETHDFYATSPVAIDMLLNSMPELYAYEIREPATGHGHMVKRMRELGLTVQATELINRSSENMLIDDCEFGVDFLTLDLGEQFNGAIVTNPPYKYAEEFIRKGIDIVADNCYVCMFLPIRYLEGKQRKKLFKELPPLKVIISSSRIECAPNGDFSKGNGSAAGYAWYIWQKGFNGKPIIEWNN